MVPPPLAVGIILCEKAIIEETTREITLVGTFRRMLVQGLPSSPRPFFLYAVLTEGQGSAKIEIAITRLETDETVYQRRFDLTFPDRLAEMQLVVAVKDCSFPAPGRYEVSLLVDRDLVAQRRLRIIAAEA